MSSSCASSNLRAAARAVTRHYDRALEPAGVTAAQLPILAAIAGGAGNSISALASALDIERSTISRDVALLERKGLVTLRSGEDKRVQELYLTAMGRRTLTKAFTAWKRAHKRLVSKVGAGELDRHVRSLRRLTKAAKSLR